MTNLTKTWADYEKYPQEKENKAKSIVWAALILVFLVAVVS